MSEVKAVSFADKFRRAMMARVPIVAVDTTEPAHTRSVVGSLWQAAVSGNNTRPVAEWDCVSGYRGSKTDSECLNPVDAISEAILMAPKNKTETHRQLVFIHMGQFYLESYASGASDQFLQALWNLRDIYALNGCMLVLLGASNIPAVMAQDIYCITDPLPTVEAIVELADNMVSEWNSFTKKSGGTEIPGGTSWPIAEALTGVSRFACEQALALCLTPEGFDVSGAWDIKEKLISNEAGVSIYRRGGNFSEVGGCDAVKSFMTGVLHGRKAPKMILWLDELEKMVGGGQDTSGVSQALAGQFLTWTSDRDAVGAIFLGPAGSGKSAVAKAVGVEGGISTVSMSLSEMKDSLVGASERRMRRALDVVDAVAQGDIFMIATCNDISRLTPELKRRFPFGPFYFDLPTYEERQIIWRIYLAKYGLTIRESEEAWDEGWTGAEIMRCCDIAYSLNLTVKQAAEYIVPVAVSGAEQLAALRTMAHNRFVSASTGARYQIPEDTRILAGVSVGGRFSDAV